MIQRATTAFLLQSAYREPSTGVAISDLAIANIQAHVVAFPFRIVSGAPSATAQIENIRVNGFYGSCYGGCDFAGSALTRPRHLRFSHVDLTVGCPEWRGGYRDILRSGRLTTSASTISGHVAGSASGGGKR